jgi:lipoprotein-releasing system permease protein
MAPNATLTPLGKRPNKRKFIVTGIITSGAVEYDLFLALTSLKEAQRLYNMGDRITNIEVKINDANNSDIISGRIRKKINFKYPVQDWKSKNQNFLATLQLNKYCQFIICMMIVLVGALNIISALVMTVMDKSRDIAILRTMGATKKSIMGIFIFQGLFTGIVGTIIGICSGLGACFFISKYEISLPAGIYPSTIPVHVDPADVFIVVFTGLSLAFLATIYPSWRASVLNPIETLRYN